MRAQRLLPTLVLALALDGVTGCAVGARTQIGGSTAPPGIGTGTTNSLVFWDRGGLLSRVGLGALGTVAAMGSVRSSSREVGSGPGYVVVETTSWVDPEAMANAQEILDAATADDPPGVESSLEIASTKLGGDTSGWMYHFGYESEPLQLSPRLIIRLYGAFGFGRYTFGEDRPVTTPSGEEPPTSQYSYIGSPLRISVLHTRWLSTYFQADLNWVPFFHWMVGEIGSGSPWHLGAKLKVGPVYVKGGLAWSRMRESGAGVELEAGLAF